LSATETAGGNRAGSRIARPPYDPPHGEGGIVPHFQETMLTTSRLLLCSLLAAIPSAQSNCVWGSFDGTRINYAAGVLTNGTSHVNLRTVIANNGGTLAPATGTLDATYLAGVDVFYTSLLHNPNGALSAAEQTALQSWVAAGGTLIVTGDIFPLPAYESFTAFYGVTGWTSIGSCIQPGGSPADVVAVHPVTVGINATRYCTNGTFTVPANARLLADDGPGDRPFMLVMEPSTGFTSGGRILVLGDHNMFSDGYINSGDNMRLAANIVRWACGCPTAAWSNYGAGWPGTNGVPSLTASANPVLGSSINVLLSSSTGSATAGLLLAGIAPASLATGFGGTLLVVPPANVPVAVPAGGLSFPLAVPNLRALCGSAVFMQAVEADRGASHGVSFSRGLELVVGQ
jgi:hypothetical protein